MKIKVLFIATLLVLFLSVSVSAFSYTPLKVSHARPYTEAVYAGSDFEIGVSARSIYSTRVKIRAIIPELGVYAVVSNVDIEDEETVTKRIIEQIPYRTQPGDYDVRITVSNDRSRRVMHRVITVF